MALTAAALAALTAAIQAACPTVVGVDPGVNQIWYNNVAPTAVEVSCAQNAYNAWMASPTGPLIISPVAFQARFTQAEQQAIWAAAAKDTTGVIGAGLVLGMTTGSINLVDPRLTAWLNALVAAGVLTQPQATNIASPNFTTPE